MRFWAASLPFDRQCPFHDGQRSHGRTEHRPVQGRPPIFLKQHGQVQEGTADALIGLRHNNTHPGEFRHAVPKLLREAGFTLLKFLEDLAATFILEEILSRLFQHFLFFIKCEFHFASTFLPLDRTRSVGELSESASNIISICRITFKNVAV